MELFGGTGDVGITQPIDALATVPLAPCDPAACSFQVDVVVPRDQLVPALRRLEAETDEILWLTVNPTLVRTFAGGSWLEVLPLDGPTERQGRLGAIEPLQGTIFPFGLLPAEMAQPILAGDGMFPTAFDWPRVVDRLRRQVGDPTGPVPTITGTLDVTFDPKCDHAVGIALHTDGGTTAFAAPDVYGRDRIHGDFGIPVGTTWRLTVHDGGGIDFDQRGGWGIRAGDIRSDGEGLTVRATFDCAAGTGVVEANPTP
jgi:hypothetical protein